MQNKENIVILGAGFGGIQTALWLLKKFKKSEFKKYNILLIDKNDYHLFTPLLYEVATVFDEKLNEKIKNVCVLKLNEIFKEYINKNQITILKKTVLEINHQNQEITLEGNQKINYQHIFLSLGAETNFPPNIIQTNVLTLKTLDSAFEIRKTLMSALQTKDKIKIIIVGAGPNGLELASQIKIQTNFYFPSKKVNILIINGSDKILSSFDEKIIRLANQRLKALNVEILNNEIIQKIENGKVITTHQTINCDIVIWTGGFKANQITQKLELPKNQQGRLIVNNFLKTDGIYALGDLATIEKEGKTLTPFSAHNAILGGKIAALNFLSEMRKSNKKINYQLSEYSYIIPLGGKYTLAKIWKFKMKGFLAWILKGVVELNYFLKIFPLWKALVLWIRGLIIFTFNKNLG